MIIEVADNAKLSTIKVLNIYGSGTINFYIATNKKSKNVINFNFDGGLCILLDNVILTSNVFLLRL